MASPQTEKGHIRIANEIIDEVIRRDFSKRQKDILHLIWRLSYGCNKKSATIPKLKYFALCGVTKQNVKKELDHLVTCRVIDWEESTNKFTFNKNHDEWIVTPGKGWNSEEFKELVAINIKEKFLKQEQDEKPKSSQNKNFKQKKVLKIRTYEFLKQELQNGVILTRSKGEWVLKDIIKDISNKDIKDNNNNPHTFFQENIAPLSPFVIEEITDWTEMFPDEVVTFSMELAVKSEKRSMNYCNKILNEWRNKGVKSIEDAKRENEKFLGRQTKVTPFKPRMPAKPKEYDYGF